MASPGIGILLAQLGTPDAPTTPALRRYLREFLGDQRVVEQNPVLWWFVLNGIILPTRPAKSAKLYQEIWTDKGSPLLVNSLEQMAGLQRLMGDQVRVELGMRYGNPTMASALDRLAAAGVDRILIFPMFPQYSGATTGSVHDAVFEHYKRKRVIPALRFVPPYYEHPGYIDALVSIARQETAKLGWTPERMLLSFHGLPQRFVDKGDVYARHCEATTAALRSALGDSVQRAYQSRFGKEPWIQPYTDVTLAALPGQGVTRLAVMCPGFTVDCLETLEEIGCDGRHIFEKAGGKDYALIPCLNASPGWLEGMAKIAREELSGWL
jgi:ferrochelatase